MQRTRFLSRLRIAVRWILGLALSLGIARFGGAGDRHARLIQVGEDGPSAGITFRQVHHPGSPYQVLALDNPMIRGQNLYAPELRRVGDRWYNYFGGWKDDGQVRDAVYLAISAGPNPAGAWPRRSVRQVIGPGTYEHVNDPAVIRDRDGTWHMLFTAARAIEGRLTDRIHYATSRNGIAWHPAEATAETEVMLRDPEGIAPGTITDAARPTMALTPDGVKVWFDARRNRERRESYLAETEADRLTELTLVHRYPPEADGFPRLMEPSIVGRPDGSYLGVIQRRFQTLHLIESRDGVAFDVRQEPAVTAGHPGFRRKQVSNPGLVYDHREDKLLGLGFGMTDSEHLTDHDIGFSWSQYRIELRDGEGTWHGWGTAPALEEQLVRIPAHAQIERVRVTDPVTGERMLEERFDQAERGDIYELQINRKP